MLRPVMQESILAFEHVLVSFFSTACVGEIPGWLDKRRRRLGLSAWLAGKVEFWGLCSFKFHGSAPSICSVSGSIYCYSPGLNGKTQTGTCGLYRWMTVTLSIMPSESSTVPWARAYRHLPWEQGNSNQRYSDDAPTIRTVEPVHVHTLHSWQRA